MMMVPKTIEIPCLFDQFATSVIKRRLTGREIISLA